jgi:hypothetical protein
MDSEWTVNGQFDDEKHLVTHQEETISQLYPRVDVLYGSIGMPAQFQAHRLVGVIVVRVRSSCLVPLPR